MTPPLVAGVLPDVTGIDKQFDYLVPDELGDRLVIGDLVRVPLHGRRVGGWVLSLGPHGADPDSDGLDLFELDRLLPIAKITGRGPGPDVVALARWACVRWAARGLRPFLVAASPPRAVPGTMADGRTETAPEPVHRGAVELLRHGGGVLRVQPGDEDTAVVAAAMARGPVLVAVPGVDQAALLAARLRRSGATVALVPSGWARALAGVDVVVGTRTAVWAPCPGLASIVVVDEHTEALQEERSPTWHARDVAVERAMRAGVPALLVSPTPTVTALAWAAGAVTRPSVAESRAGWPLIDVVDRSRDEPWQRSLLTSQLIAALRDRSRIVVCVHNAKGRARITACRTCGTLARCERCGAAVRVDDAGRFVCGHCGANRAAVCLQCHGTAFANLRPGVTRLVEEIAAAANRQAAMVTGDDAELPAEVGVYIGTEAVLHRVRRADVVAFLDIDAELLAPRYRAGEQAMALIVRAARLVGPRGDGGRVMLQTSLPRHEVVQAALLADPERLARAEARRRRHLSLPPYAALAVISGAGSEQFASALRDTIGRPLPAGWSVGVLAGARGVSVRAPDWMALGEALVTTPRPKGSRLRVEVDPPRL